MVKTLFSRNKASPSTCLQRICVPVTEEMGQRQRKAVEVNLTSLKPGLQNLQATSELDLLRGPEWNPCPVFIPFH